VKMVIKMARACVLAT